jgi:hypothetical protein
LRLRNSQDVATGRTLDSLANQFLFHGKLFSALTAYRNAHEQTPNNVDFTSGQESGEACGKTDLREAGSPTFDRS